MAVTASPRLGVTRWSAGTDPFRRSQLDADHGILDSLVGRFDTPGLLSARPAAAIRDRFYYATDTATLYRDTGAAWEVVGAKVSGLAVVQQTVGQTGSLEEWRSSAGAALASIDVAGVLTAKRAIITGLAATVPLQVISGDAAQVAVIHKGAAAQTADLVQWQSSAAAVLSRIRADGGHEAPAVAAVGNTGPHVTLTTGGVAVVNRTNAANVPLVVQGMAAQTGVMTEWRNSAGTALVKIDTGGVRTPEISGVTSSIGIVLDQPGVLILNPSLGAVGDVLLAARGKAAQTGDLTQWQNSAAAVLAKISAAGVLTAAGLVSNGFAVPIVTSGLKVGTTDASGNIVVTHGQTVAPTSVVATSKVSAVGRVFYEVTSIGATTFTAKCIERSGASTATVAVEFYWTAVA